METIKRMDKLEFILKYFRAGNLDWRKAYSKFRIAAGERVVYSRRWWRPAAFALALATVTAVLFFRWQNSVTEYFAPDVVQTFTLGDGSRVTLAPGSSMSLKPHRNPRALSMSGTIFFSVSHDAGHPFTVSARGLRITVLGTEFQVAETSDSTTQVSVTQGRVKLASRDTLILTAGQSAKLSRDSLSRIHSSPNPCAWATGRFIYDATPLADVLKELSDFYGEHLSTKAPGKLLTAEFSTEDSLDDVVSLIEYVLEVKVDRL